MSVAVKSPANIAFVKHWGVSFDGLPLSASLSMNLSSCFTISEFEFSEVDEVIGEGLSIEDFRISRQIDLVRDLADSDKCVRINTRNNFPSSAGIASSASGFSALTFGLTELFGLELDLQNLARLTAKCKSISAVRSLVDYFGEVNMNDGVLEVSQCNEFNGLDLVDIVVIVDSTAKLVGSFEAQMATTTSPLFQMRIEQAKKDVVEIKTADLKKIGQVIQLETAMLHGVCMTANPPIDYLSAATFEVMKLVLDMQSDGIEVYYSIDAGANVHLIMQSASIDEVKKRVQELSVVKSLIINYPAVGTHLL